jgi:hypothetical protein
VRVAKHIVYRREEERLSSTYRIVQPWLLTPTTFDAARDVDKAFCSVSPGPDNQLSAGAVL